MSEWNHESVWGAIDALAARHQLSPSGLARKAGLDATAFNPSKRHGNDRRPRWPSTESIAKVLAATGESLQAFVELAAGEKPAAGAGRAPPPFLYSRTLPLLGFAEAGIGGFFDDGGFPVGEGWGEVAFPFRAEEAAYALEVSGDSMLPLYRDGDVVIVSRSARVRRGDRVVVKTTDGEVMAKVLERQSDSEVQLASLNPDHPARTIARKQIEWMARILWASQ